MYSMSSTYLEPISQPTSTQAKSSPVSPYTCVVQLVEYVSRYISTPTLATTLRLLCVNKSMRSGTVQSSPVQYRDRPTGRQDRNLPAAPRASPRPSFSQGLQYRDAVKVANKVRWGKVPLRTVQYSTVLTPHSYNAILQKVL